MNKLILCSILAFEFANADQQYTWKMAQEFNNSVLKDIGDGYRKQCYIFSVYNTFFSVACEPDQFIFELPYTWRGWKIIRQSPGLAIYSNEY